jgi:hypothetical protein
VIVNEGGVTARHFIMGRLVDPCKSPLHVSDFWKVIDWTILWTTALNPVGVQMDCKIKYGGGGFLRFIPVGEPIRE